MGALTPTETLPDCTGYGSNAVTGVSRFFPLPRVAFKFACANFLNVALSSSAAADFEYLTTNRKFVENAYGREFADLLLFGPKLGE